MISLVDYQFGPAARERLAASADPGRDGAVAARGLDPSDLIVSIVENEDEDWSFGQWPGAIPHRRTDLTAVFRGAKPSRR